MTGQIYSDSGSPGDMGSTQGHFRDTLLPPPTIPWVKARPVTLLQVQGAELSSASKARPTRIQRGQRDWACCCSCQLPSEAVMKVTLRVLCVCGSNGSFVTSQDPSESPEDHCRSVGSLVISGNEWSPCGARVRGREKKPVNYTALFVCPRAFSDCICVCALCPRDSHCTLFLLTPALPFLNQDVASPAPREQQVTGHC